MDKNTWLNGEKHKSQILLCQRVSKMVQLEEKNCGKANDLGE